MCWCEPLSKTPWCGKGPCNSEDIHDFQEHVKRAVPMLAKNNEFMQRVTESYAKDMDAWVKMQGNLADARKMGEAAAKYRDQVIVKILVAAQQ